MARIAIIGGGPGGLLTACLIARKYGGECRTTIFEAAERLGGKLRTSTFTAAPVPYESGAAEIYDYSGVGEDPFRRLIDELDLVTHPMQGHTVILDGHVLRDDADIARHYGEPAMRALHDFRRRVARLMPLAQWHPGSWSFDAAHPWARRTCEELLNTVQNDTARRYLAVATHSDLATEPHLTDGLNGLKNFAMDIPGYVSCHAIEGGMSRLAERLAECIGDAEVVPGTRVVRIERKDHSSWRIVSARRGRSQSNDFDAVVLAMPARQLSTIEYTGSRLRHAMNQHIAHFDRPGHYLRVSLLFRAPFWRARLTGSWFMVDAFGGACVYDESARYDALGYGVLGFLIPGDAALTLENVDKATLTWRVIESLPADLHKAALNNLLEVRVHRWCAGVSAQPGGQPVRDPCMTHQPDTDRLRGLLLVGDYLFDSTLNGVCQSADLATTLLPNHLVAGALADGEPWRTAS
jgi:predicted NAD/FAD-dependent oxidoreductase